MMILLEREIVSENVGLSRKSTADSRYFDSRRFFHSKWQTWRFRAAFNIFCALPIAF
jgi:hypothetical protein